MRLFPQEFGHPGALSKFLFFCSSPERKKAKKETAPRGRIDGRQAVQSLESERLRRAYRVQGRDWKQGKLLGFMKIDEGNTKHKIRVVLNIQQLI